MRSCISRAKTKTEPDRLMKIVPRQHEIARQDHADGGHEPNRSAPEIRPRQPAPAARRQPEQSRRNEQPQLQAQMRGMAGHRQTGQAGYPTATPFVQALAAKQEQIAAQDHHRRKESGST